MGRNRKGRQCGGYESKMERFMLQRKWQYEMSKAVTRLQQNRQAAHQRHIAGQQNDATSSSSYKRRVRVDVVKALMNARLKDDHVERIKIKSAEHIATALEKTSTIQHYASLQERCLHEIARTFDCYASSCPFTDEWFGTFEPWMLTRLSELATAMKTMNDGNVALLLQQPTDELTIGFVRDEKALARLYDRDDGDRQRMVWQLNALTLGTPQLQQQVDSWDELDVDDVDIVQTHDEIHLQRLQLISCAGLTLSFLTKLMLEHPFIEHLKVIDCFDTVSGADGTALLHQLSRWRQLKTLHFSWCCWLTTDMLVTFAYHLLEPPRAALEEFHVSDCFDVVDDYIRSLFMELHPQIRLTF
uniref:Uncharacterized protein n=1 Tax=Globisporangium ultimum (strain ATCC 200006 / CBS 805.95 / DAOM BR144) TaxID=431595 RepID=K3X292_GLOUD